MQIDALPANQCSFGLAAEQCKVILFIYGTLESTVCTVKNDYAVFKDNSCKSYAMLIVKKSS